MEFLMQCAFQSGKFYLLKFFTSLKHFGAIFFSGRSLPVIVIRNNRVGGEADPSVSVLFLFFAAHCRGPVWTSLMLD